MKLLMNDGTRVDLVSYQKQTVTLSGEKVDAVSYTIGNTSLDAINKLFNDTANYEVVKVYSDLDVLKDTFVGYQKRVETAFGEDTTQIRVVFAQASEITEHVKRLSELVNTQTSEIDGLKKLIAALSDGYKELAEGQLKEIATNTAAYATSVEKIAASYDEMEKLNASYKDAVDNYAAATNGYAKATEQMSATLTSVNDDYNQMLASSKALDATVKQCYDDIHKASLDFTAKTGTINTLASQVETVINSNCEMMDSNNQFKIENSNLVSKCEDVLKTGEEIQKKYTETDEKYAEQNDKTSELSRRVEALEPITDYTTLPLSEAKEFRVTETKTELAKYLEEHPITSSCHKGIPARYSITEEKQNYLQAMIMMTSAAAAAGVDYHPSWNATGEECSYDWTLAELQQLAIEIEATVRPLISAQQHMETEIMACTTMEDLKKIVITYVGVFPNEIKFQNAESDDVTNDGQDTTGTADAAPAPTAPTAEPEPETETDAEAKEDAVEQETPVDTPVEPEVPDQGASGSTVVESGTPQSDEKSNTAETTDPVDEEKASSGDGADA